MKEEKQIRYRTFKVSISIFFFGGLYDTTVHKVRNNFTLILYASWYTLLTLLLGWWGRHLFNNFQGITNSIDAIKTNLSGGIEYTEKKEDFEYDQKTIHIWKNILQETSKNVSKQDLEILIEIQDDYEKSYKERYDDENIEFIFKNLEKIQIRHITKDNLIDVFQAMEIYNNYLSIK